MCHQFCQPRAYLVVHVWSINMFTLLDLTSSYPTHSSYYREHTASNETSIMRRLKPVSTSNIFNTRTSSPQLQPSLVITQTAQESLQSFRESFVFRRDLDQILVYRKRSGQISIQFFSAGYPSIKQLPKLQHPTMLMLSGAVDNMHPSFSSFSPASIPCESVVRLPDHRLLLLVWTDHLRV